MNVTDFSIPLTVYNDFQIVKPLYKAPEYTVKAKQPEDFIFIFSFSDRSFPFLQKVVSDCKLSFKTQLKVKAFL